MAVGYKGHSGVLWNRVWVTGAFRLDRCAQHSTGRWHPLGDTPLFMASCSRSRSFVDVETAALPSSIAHDQSMRKSASLVASRKPRRRAAKQRSQDAYQRELSSETTQRGSPVRVDPRACPSDTRFLRCCLFFEDFLHPGRFDKCTRLGNCATRGVTVSPQNFVPTRYRVSPQHLSFVFFLLHTLTPVRLLVANLTTST